ncbi:alpha/beta fold family hydrolase [Nitzschia inconspicua]|uniref:Alpha/beta fold family hydrolase n=1 Tax=Nitzschia inconspicua TaxID=303405 RepID=A0A9K3PEL6_9STRA|nr:alpha/beta fold family hydrolase [Nitzschia inconspicua]KAG7344697.1 alpha/beta fold family hydrolase [Nitzschia inconspicua]KAG7370405.1 alpha/beta fold family hydrolase [Nitzschia inconspicua]
MTSCVPTFLFFGCALLYWAYKVFRGPTYKPGSVAKKSVDDPSTFDDCSLYSKTTDAGNKWVMPGQINIFYFEPSIEKKGITPTIAVHGGPGIAPQQSWKLFSGNNNAFLPNFFLYHARGCGYSTRPFHQWPTPGKMWPGIQTLEQTLGIGQQVADIERIRRRLAVVSGQDIATFQINLIGHSFGGFISTLYATEFPQHVRSVVLLEPAGVMKLPNPQSDLFAMVRNGLEGNPHHLDEFDDWFREYMDFSTLPQQTETTLARRQFEFAQHYDRAAPKTDNESLPPTPMGMIGGMAAYATFASMGMEHDYTTACHDRLKDSTFPVTIVHGSKDMAPEDVSRSYCQLFPTTNVTYKIIEGANHFLFDHPDIVPIVQEALTMK